MGISMELKIFRLHGGILPYALPYAGILAMEYTNNSTIRVVI